MAGTEGTTRLFGIVAEEVDRFAHLGNGVQRRLARFPDNQSEERRHACLHEAGGAVQAGGALGG